MSRAATDDSIGRVWADSIGRVWGAPSRQPGVRVMVIDDHAGVRKGMRAMLESEMEIDAAASAGDAPALAVPRRVRSDAVVLDRRLPDEGGPSFSLASPKWPE